LTQLSEIIRVLEAWAPPVLQEGYDNSGLQIGRGDKSINKALISLDITPEVIEEAIVQKCNLIIAHHPLIFRPLQRVTGRNMVERCVEAAIKNDIAIYAIHTNLDNVHNGVNQILSEKLGLQSARILQTGKSHLKKLAVFVPQDHRDKLLTALFAAGAGRIGN
jgi:dinuclear metal center YbgI/SA1388 family protein